MAHWSDLHKPKRTLTKEKAREIALKVEKKMKEKNNSVNQVAAIIQLKEEIEAQEVSTIAKQMESAFANTNKHAPQVQVSLNVSDALALRMILEALYKQNRIESEEWETKHDLRQHLVNQNQVIERVIKALPDDSKPPF